MLLTFSFTLSEKEEVKMHQLKPVISHVLPVTFGTSTC